MKEFERDIALSLLFAVNSPFNAFLILSLTPIILHLSDSYYIDELGSGKFGNVRAARLISNMHKRYAVKTISKELLGDQTLLLMREIDIFTQLDHPNIVKFFESYQDQQYFHIVMEYCSGGELLTRVAKRGYLGENEAKRIMRQALSAVRYIHEKGIVHRDLKLENFLFESENPDASLKLIDFGLSKRYDPTRQNLRTVLGTSHYIAPEVLLGKYTDKCDEWSLGVMMYIILSGNPPFEGANDAQILKAVADGQYSLEGPFWRKISAEAKDLISKLLEMDVNARWTAAQALEHSWFKDKEEEVKSLVDLKKESGRHEFVMRNLTQFHKQHKFKREALEVMVTQLKEEELQQLKDAFQFFDKKGTGEITIAELKQVMNEMGLNHTNALLEKIIKNVRLEDKDSIRYMEFLTAALDRKAYSNREMLWTAFKFFDVDSKNSISMENIKVVMARAGKMLAEPEIQELEQQFGGNNGRITFEEFCEFMIAEGLQNQEGNIPEEDDDGWHEVAMEKERDINDIKISEVRSQPKEEVKSQIKGIVLERK